MIPRPIQVGDVIQYFKSGCAYLVLSPAAENNSLDRLYPIWTIEVYDLKVNKKCVIDLYPRSFFKVEDYTGWHYLAYTEQ